jgi:ubiquinone/menaquinone biosynthesis C-methylase UbiE
MSNKHEDDTLNDRESAAMKADIAALYSRAAPLYSQIGPTRFVYVGRRLVEHLGIGEGAHVLDVAAGRGANLFPAAEKVGMSGYVTGIDISEGMVRETSAEIARRSIQNAEMRRMDAEHLQFGDASFDFITCGFAIFLFPHPEAALAEMRRVLRPGGMVGLSVAHNPDALSQWYGAHLTAYAERYGFPLRVGGDRLQFTSNTSHLERAGFHDAHIIQESKTFIYASPQVWWDEKWTHGTRYALEHMSPDVREQFKKEVLAKLVEEQQPDGIHEEWRIHYHIGRR